MEAHISKRKKKKTHTHTNIYKRDCHEYVCVSLAKSNRKHDPIEQAIQVLHLCFESSLRDRKRWVMLWWCTVRLLTLSLSVFSTKKSSSILLSYMEILFLYILWVLTHTHNFKMPLKRTSYWLLFIIFIPLFFG